jgi:pimeloyl-ACP methyl ester carboxylesterase
MTWEEKSMKKNELLIALIVFGLTWAGITRAEDQPMAQQTKPTILLVHGAWADSSSWNGVVDLLLKDGYDVRALPNTLRGLSADAAVISTYLKSVPGPVVLAGHSYGGSVISVASADAPNVKALVFVDAFAPDAGESVQSELASAPPPPPDSRLRCPSRDPATMRTCTSIPNISERCLHPLNRRMSRRG